MKRWIILLALMVVLSGCTIELVGPIKVTPGAPNEEQVIAERINALEQVKSEHQLILEINRLKHEIAAVGRAPAVRVPPTN